MTEIVCSGALFYAKNTKRFMLVQRANKKHLRQWGIVGGKAEGKELPVEALKREIKEAKENLLKDKSKLPASVEKGASGETEMLVSQERPNKNKKKTNFE